MRAPFCQRGNILFLILLAVVLFAALAYAVTSSMRGGGKSASSEQSDLLASQIIQYASLIENTVQRAMIINDVKDYQLDLSGTNVSSTYTNYTACTNANCRIFSTSARPGLMESMLLPQKASSAPEIANNLTTKFYVGSILNVGTSADDLSIVFEFLTLEVCNALNRTLNLNVNVATGETWGGTNPSTIYSGPLTSFPTTNGAVIGDQNAAFIGRLSGCYKHTTLGYSFYHVILVR